uniref:Uncharacterized protein n=1 Tax=Cacopsylla melanoneura TaxID=428564 RepID=A0A8D9DY20_9HEMI
MELDAASLLSLSEYFFSSPASSLLAVSPHVRIRRNNMRRRNRRNMKIALLLHEVFDDSDDSLDENDLDIFSEGEDSEIDDEMITNVSNQNRTSRDNTSWLDNYQWKGKQPLRGSDGKFVKKSPNQKQSIKTKSQPSVFKAKSRSKIHSKTSTESHIFKSALIESTAAENDPSVSKAKFVSQTNPNPNTESNLLKSALLNIIPAESTTVNKDPLEHDESDDHFDPESLISEVEVDMTDGDQMYFDGAGGISIAGGVQDVLHILENVQSTPV